MNKELREDILKYTINDDIDILFRAILNEVAYQYDDIKLNYTDYNNIDLTLDDLEEITKNIMSTYYMNEGLNELIQYSLNDYIKGDNKNV